MPADLARRARPINAPTNQRTAWLGSRLGHLPLIVFAAAAGLLLCSVANALSRATVGEPMLLYWAGILLIALPIFYRLTSRQAGSGERFALVCLLGITLFGVKVIRDVPMFTFSDELVHAFNANQIAIHHHLFETNSILKVTPYYPGLEGATSALTTITGASSYAAGIIVIGAARLALISALFLLFRRVSGSARTAGLGAAIYTGNFNFLFWGAQYSYESLALPLLLVIMLALAERETAPRAALRAWSVPIALGTVAVVVTHHLTSYALVAILTALSAAYWFVRRSWQPPNPWRFAVFAALLAAAWLIVVAGSTVGYLSPVLTGAAKAIAHTISGESPPRALFQKGATSVESTPLPARAVALLAIAALTAALPFGLWRVWRRYRTQPFALVFAIAALGFFGTLALRLTPPAWETGNRASEFLFIGLAFVVACVGLETWRPRAWPGLGRVLLTAGLGVVLVGGAISGWPWDVQLAKPMRISASNGTIVSPPLGMAEWAAHDIDKGRFAAATADANLLLVPGNKSVLTGPFPNVEDILAEPELAGWQLPLLRRHHLRYVVSDLRNTSTDGLRGYYFSTGNGSAREELLPKSVTVKFNRVPGAARVYTNGTITVFDLEGRR